MSLISPILRSAEGSRLLFWCPGCNAAHQIRATLAKEILVIPDESNPDWTPPAEYYNQKTGSWSWNGNLREPSFLPSVLVTYNGKDAGIDGAPPAICHSFVKNGQIQFLNDSTHALAGKTIDIPRWPTGYSVGA